MTKEKNKNSQRPEIDNVAFRVTFGLEISSKESGVPPNRVKRLFQQAYDKIRRAVPRPEIAAVIMKITRILKEYILGRGREM